MLEKYIEEQETVTKLLKQSLENNKLVQAYLFVCDDINYIYEYAKDFTKEIIKLSNLDENILKNIYKRIDKEEYTELKIIIPSGNFIKKEQLLELQKSTLTKPVEANKIVYIIKNCEKLNSSSANCILKFLEEPSDDIIAILLTDNINMVIPTIKSRCQVLNFKNVKNNVNNAEKLKQNLIEYLSEDLSQEDFDTMINSSIEFIKKVEKNKKNTIIEEKNLLWDKFKTNNEIFILLNVMVYSYMDSLYFKLNNEINYMNDYLDLIEYISKNNEINDIINKVNIVEKIKNDLIYNINQKLLFDRLIIELSEV